MALTSTYNDGERLNASKLRALIPRFSVRDPAFGAVGDGVTDDRAAVQAAIDAAYDYAVANDTLVEVYIPPGVYSCENAIWPRQRSVIRIHGTLLFNGGDNKGGFVVVLNVTDLAIVGDGIGVIDANFQGNDNPLAIGGNFPEDALPNASLGKPPQVVQFAERILVRDLTIRNARHGGQHVTPGYIGDIGRGGGKGITCQFGNRLVDIDTVRIENCDIGFSQEGDTVSPDEHDWSSYAVRWTNVSVIDCRFIGAYISSSNASDLSTIGCRFTNVQFFNCANGLDNDDNPICESFGVVTIDAAGKVKGNCHIWSTEGRCTMLRGGGRGNKLSIDANVQAARDIIDLNPFAGNDPSTSSSRRNQYDVDAYINDYAGLEYGIRGYGSSLAQGNKMDITWSARNTAGTAFATTWPGSGPEVDHANLGAGNVISVAGISDASVSTWRSDTSEMAYTNSTRPAASAMPYARIFNTQTGIPNWSNGTNWVDAAGNVV